MKKSLVVATDSAKLNELAALLRGVGLRPDVMLGTEFLPKEPMECDIILGRIVGREALAALRGHLAPGGVIVALLPMSSGLGDMVSWLGVDDCCHVIREEPGWETLLTTTLDKLVSGSIFGLERYLPKDTNLHLLRFQTYKGRSAAIDKIVRHAKRARFRGSQRQAIAQATEELLMNALYNAPVDEEGQMIFGDVQPKERLSMESPKPVSVRFAATGDLFGIAIRDRYGKFSKDTLVGYIEKCLRQEDDQIDSKVSGAGLGLYFVASRASLFVYNIAEGVATEAIALFERKRSGSGEPRAMGMFRYDGGPR